MLIMKIKNKMFLSVILLFSLSLAGCFVPEFWVRDEDVDAAQYTDNDVRERAEQISDYWLYKETSQKKQDDIMNEVEKWETDWVMAGAYVVGEDIEAGVYIACPHGEDIYVMDEEDSKPYERIWYLSTSYNEAFYLMLNEGNKVQLNGEARIAPVDEGAPSLAAMEDGVYYEGTYLVGEEMAEGEYFVVNLLFGHVVSELENDTFHDSTRFWYVRIEDCEFVNVSGCVLFPMGSKPEVHPIKYQGTGEGEGSHVYPNGTYKIGIDIPTGTYKLKNELFPAGNNGPDAVGYHGSVDSYYPFGVNWCGLVAGSGFANGDYAKMSEYRREDIKKLGWFKIELDNRLKRPWRSTKVTRLTSDGVETEYKIYWGLPTITFTEEDIGCCIRVDMCILIPTE